MRVARRLSVSDGSVTLFADNRQIWALHWEEITRIETYRVDLFTVDMICLDFVVASRQLTYRTDEEMQGFDALCQQLQYFFPSITPDWWSQVAWPVFATQFEVLCEKGSI